jgi:hypothetical protein
LVAAPCPCAKGAVFMMIASAAAQFFAMETALWGWGQSVLDNLVLLGGADELRGPRFRAPPHAATSSFDLQNQRDEFALAMCVGLGKGRFQLIARRLP